ncbi:MAG: nucleotide exchange factor GrpE [Ruthenibacterium sp.]
MMNEKDIAAKAAQNTGANKKHAPYDYDKDLASAPDEAKAQTVPADDKPAAEKNAAQPAPQSSAAGKPETDDRKAHKQEKEAKHAAELTALKAHAEQLEKQAGSAKETLLRTVAEYDNYRKRSAREHDAAFGNGVCHAVEKLLPILDTLALAANTQTADEGFKKGVELTLDQCKKAFDELGVKEINALNQPFDPNLHAAVLQQPAPEGTDSGTVLQVLQTGYTLGDKVIRHATVAVAE